MQRRRFAQIAAVAFGLPALWALACRGEDSRPAGAAAAFEPLFARFTVAPGNDPTSLPAAIGDADLIEIDRTGALLVHSGSRVRRQQKPRAYQDIDGRRHEVAIRFDIAAAGDPRFVLGSYDRAYPLVIESEP